MSKLAVYGTEADRGAVPSGAMVPVTFPCSSTVTSLRLTLPASGCAPPATGLAAATVAVNVTVSPTYNVVPDVARVTAVPSGTMLTDTEFDVIPLKYGSPL